MTDSAIPTPYYMTTAAERAMQLLTSGSPESALRLSLGHADTCWLSDDLRQWRYWHDVAQMVRVLAVIGFEYRPPWRRFPSKTG